MVPCPATPQRWPAPSWSMTSPDPEGVRRRAAVGEDALRAPPTVRPPDGVRRDDRPGRARRLDARRAHAAPGPREAPPRRWSAPSAAARRCRRGAAPSRRTAGSSSRAGRGDRRAARSRGLPTVTRTAGVVLCRPRRRWPAASLPSTMSEAPSPRTAGPGTTRPGAAPWSLPGATAGRALSAGPGRPSPGGSTGSIADAVGGHLVVAGRREGEDLARRVRGARRAPAAVRRGHRRPARSAAAAPEAAS